MDPLSMTDPWDWYIYLHVPRNAHPTKHRRITFHKINQAPEKSVATVDGKNPANHLLYEILWNMRVNLQSSTSLPGVLHHQQATIRI